MASSSLASTRVQESVDVLLTLIAGYVDGYGYITYSTFLSFMSGNTTQSGYKIGEGKLTAAIPPLTAILFFVLGAFTGTLLAHSGTRRSRRLVLLLAASLLTLIVGVLEVSSIPNYLQIATLCLAMGAMNTLLGQVGAEQVNLTYVTGTLSKIGRYLALAVKHAPLPDAQGPWDTHKRRAVMLVIIWSAFFLGALLAGTAAPRFGARTLMPAVLVLFMLAVSNPAVKKATKPKSR
jgi:uncharacterized membrane protein YoaK (UPF0700 family)